MYTSTGNSVSSFVLFTQSLLVLEMELALQVDDEHWLYVNGELASSGGIWNVIHTITTAEPVTTIAIYAKNTVSSIMFS